MAEECEFSLGVNRYFGTIVVTCEKHKTKEARLSELCAKRLLLALQDYGSPFSALLRASVREKEVSHLRLENDSREIEEEENATKHEADP